MRYNIKLIYEVENHLDTTQAVLPSFATQNLREWLTNAAERGGLTIGIIKFVSVAPITTSITQRIYTAYSVLFDVILNGVNDEIIQLSVLRAIPIKIGKEDYELFGLINIEIEPTIA